MSGVPPRGFPESPELALLGSGGHGHRVPAASTAVTTLVARDVGRLDEAAASIADRVVDLVLGLDPAIPGQGRIVREDRVGHEVPVGRLELAQETGDALAHHGDPGVVPGRTPSHLAQPVVLGRTRDYVCQAVADLPPLVGESTTEEYL